MAYIANHPISDFTKPFIVTLACAIGAKIAQMAFSRAPFGLQLSFWAIDCIMSTKLNNFGLLRKVARSAIYSGPRRKFYLNLKILNQIQVS